MFRSLKLPTLLGLQTAIHLWSMMTNLLTASEITHLWRYIKAFDTLIRMFVLKTGLWMVVCDFGIITWNLYIRKSVSDKIWQHSENGDDLSGDILRINCTNLSETYPVYLPSYSATFRMHHQKVPCSHWTLFLWPPCNVQTIYQWPPMTHLTGLKPNLDI